MRRRGAEIRWPLSVAPGTIGNVSALDYLVIYVSDLEASAQFYGALGLTLVREQHGFGPVHYSAQLGPTVLEAIAALQADGPIARLGLLRRGPRGLIASPELLDALADQENC